MTAELYPNRLRATGASSATVANWSANLLITVTFLSAVDALGKDVVFWIYAAFAAVGMVFVRLLVPETKDRSLEDIEDYWTQGHTWQNGNGRRRSRNGAGTDERERALGT